MRNSDSYRGGRGVRDHRASPSLDDLNSALDSLEQRMGIAARPAAGVSELDEIRSRQRQISAAQTPSPTGRADVLKQELADLRRDLARERQRAPLTPVAPATAIGDPAMTSLRDDIEQLKHDVTLLAREDSIRDLADRWSVLEREFARLPETLGTRDDLLGVVDRIDQLSEALAALPSALPIDGMEHQLHSLANAMERMAAAQQPVPGQSIDALHGRLDEIAHMVSAMPAQMPAAAYDPAPIERLEARVAGLAHALEARDEPDIDRIDDHFAALARRMDDVQRAAAAAVDTQPLDDIIARLETLFGAVQDIASQPGVAANADEQNLLIAMADRLEAISERVEAQEQMASQTAGTITSALDDRMAQLAAFIEQANPVAGSGADTSRLEERLEEIGSMLAQAPAPAVSAVPVSADLSGLEAQIAHLSQELTSLTANQAPAIIDPQLGERLASIESHLQHGGGDIMATARAAAEQAVSQLDAGARGTDGEAVRVLADKLGELDELSRATTSRNTQTFEAIHDTLLKVVDHLSGLEERVAVQPVMAASPAPETLQEAFGDELESVDAPPTAMDEPMLPEGPDADPEPLRAAPAGRRAQAMPPAHAAAAAALAALNNDEAIAGALGPEEPRKTATAQADGLGPQEPELGDALDDVMVAPGADGPDLASIIQRVRNEGAQVRASTTDASGVESAKSDFIAAARRAAQAAVADASVAETKDKNADGSGRLAGIKGALGARRKPILMGAGAILLAVLAVSGVSRLMGSGSDDLAMLDEPVPMVSEPIMDMGSDADAVILDGAEIADEAVLEADAADAEETPIRVIEDGPAEPVQAAAPALGTDAGAFETPVAANLTVPEGIGSIQLQEAAANGDPKAMFVVAEAVAASGGNSPQSLAEAAQWYQKAAELGFAPAQYRFGNFLEKGTAGTQDAQQAQLYYQLAAQQGNASAMHNLGSLTAGGTLGSPDLVSAAQWFHSAAELGVRDSQFNLGILYGLGNGVDVDLVESYKWFALAANDGDAMAAERRDEVAAQLSEEQLEMARGAVTLWQAKPINAEANSVDVPDAWKISEERVAATEPAAGQADPDVMARAVRNIQTILNQNGYDAGPVDGMMGDKTRTAIIAFQRDNGMTPDGTINEALVEKLLEVHNANLES